jgi:Transmembrane secretion effector
MAIGGVAYIATISRLYTIGMQSAPKWIGARVLAVYLLVLNGSLAIGSVLWGITANIIGIPVTLSIDSLALVSTILIARKRNRFGCIDFRNKWCINPYIRSC